METLKRRAHTLWAGLIVATLFILWVLQGASFAAPPPLANPNIFVELAKKVMPSVVNISTYTTSRSGGFPGGQGMNQDEYFKWFFEEFFGQPGGGGSGPGAPGGPYGKKRPRSGPSKGEKMPLSMGTGFVIDADGLIVTNNHVVGDADDIKIKFTEDPAEEPTDGTVIGKDPDLDVALIRVKTKRALIPLPFGNSDELEVGEYVAAAGNPFGRGHSISHGIVSAKHRDAPGLLAKYIQTDAPINPGNSGGPLVNLKGEVIGVNNAIDARAQGIGFSIPINLVKNVLPQLKTKGVVERGYVGILVSELSPEIAEQVGAPSTLRAPFVTHVDPGEPAAQAGIKPYDVVTEINGKTVRTSNDLVLEVTGVPVGGKAAVKVLRQGKEKTFNIIVARRPDSPKIAAWKQNRSQSPGEKTPPSAKSGLYTGLSLQELTSSNAKQFGLTADVKGLVVVEVADGSPAEKAGLTEGNVILEVNQKEVESLKQFNSIVSSKQSYLLRVQRSAPNGQPVFWVAILDLKA